MFLRVETSWPCVSPHVQQPCGGTLTVISEEEAYSVACMKCSMGITGNGPLPQFWLKKLVEQGYIRELARRPVEDADLREFMLKECRNHRTPQEMAGDLTEKFVVFWK